MMHSAMNFPEKANLFFLLQVVFCCGAVCLPLQNVKAQSSESTNHDLPGWVSEVLSAENSISASTTVTARHASYGQAREELQTLLIEKVDRWLRTQPETERLRTTKVDWEIVNGLASARDLWIGQVPDDSSAESGEQRWVGVAKVELEKSLLEKAESLVASRSIMARVEKAMLALAAVVGTVGIVWFSLLLDHKTRHHFSRRFQMLAAAMWLAMGIAIFIVWRMVLI